MKEKGTIAKIARDFYNSAKADGILCFWIGLLLKKSVGEEKFAAIVNNKNFGEELFKNFRQISQGERLSFLSLLEQEKYIGLFKKNLKNLRELLKVPFPGSTVELIELYEKTSDMLQKKRNENIYSIKREMYRFVIELMEIQSNATIYDPTFDLGRFFVEVLKENFNAKISGDEVNETYFLITNTFFYLVGQDNSGLNRKDITLAKNFPSEKFDRIFIEPPLGVNLEKEKIQEYYVATYRLGWPERLEVALLEAGIELLKDDGILAAVLSERFFCRNEIMKGIRKELVESNLLDGIIKLPTNNKKADEAILVILKKSRKTDRIAFLDLSKSPESFKSRELDRIAKNYRSKKDLQGMMKTVNSEDIKKKNYNLLPALYIYGDDNLDYLIEEFISNQSISLGDIAELFTGLNINNSIISKDSELKDFVEIFMVKPSSINSKGWIEFYSDEKAKKIGSKSETLISKLNIGNDKLLQNGDIVMVSRGGIGKVGYVDGFISKYSIFPGNNLIVIRIKDKKKYPPRILFEYLKSNSVKQWIEIEVKANKLINIKDLKKLLVPRFSIDPNIESELDDIEKTAFDIQKKLSCFDEKTKKVLVDLVRKNK